MLRLSPTAIKRYAACNRSWRYSRDIRAQQKPSAALGERIEAVCNRYALGQGFTLASKESRIAFPALKHIPTPVPESALQYPFSYAGPPGVTYAGKMDLRLPPAVYDFKSTQSIDDWALNDETFPDDIQRVIYAEEIDADVVPTRWIYMQTVRPYRAELVELVEPKVRVHERRVGLIDPLAIAMAATVNDPPLSFDRNLKQCGAFGGCPYKPQCYADQPPTLAEQIKGSAMGSPMLERLKKNAAAAQAGAAQTSSTPLDGPADEPTPTEQPAPKADGPRMPPLKRGVTPKTSNDLPAVSGEIVTTELTGFVQALIDAALDAADAGEDYKAQTLICAAATMRKRGAA